MTKHAIWMLMLLTPAVALGQEPEEPAEEPAEGTEEPAAGAEEPAEEPEEPVEATPEELPDELEPSEPPTEPDDAPGPPVRHLPLGTVSADEPATLWFVVRNPQDRGEVVVRWRPDDDRRVRETLAARRGEGYTAVIPTDDLRFPGLEYWVVRRVDGREEPVFASADDPHPLTVTEPPLVRYERARLAERDGRRSRAILTGEYVGLGTRAVEVVDGTRRALDEHYYQLEASYSYSFFTFVDEIRLSLGRMRGNVVDIDALDRDEERGIDYGTARITWRAHDLLRFTTGVLFGFSQDGFELGGSLDAVVGQPEGTSLTLGLEGVTTLGATGRVRLGWLTIPSVPMGATIEVTNYPAGDAAGVRLLYDIGYELYPGAYARIEAGYRGWTATTGGPSLGGELALAF